MTDDDTDEIRLDVTEGVALVTLDAPARRNALTPTMAGALVAACEQIDGDPSVAVTVIAATGSVFCAGGDRATLGAAGRDPLAPAARAAIDSVYGAFTRVGRLLTPTIAAVHGPAVGAGMNLALACDLRIVATDARLLSGFLRIGLHPGGGHLRMLVRRVGWEAAAAMALFDEELSGTEAVDRGLAWRAVPAGDVLSTARALAERIARDPELARMTVESLRSTPEAPATTALEAERSRQAYTMRRKHVGDEA